MVNSSSDAFSAIGRSYFGQVVTAGRSDAKSTDIANRSIKLNAEIPVQVDKAALEVAVRMLNELVTPALQTVTFRVDEEYDRVVVRVIDTQTKNVLRQIPNEEVLAFSQTLGKLQGLVIRQTA